MKYSVSNLFATLMEFWIEIQLSQHRINNFYKYIFKKEYMMERESFLTNVYTPMLKNSLKSTFAKAPDPPNIDFSDVEDHDLSIRSIPTCIIDSCINNTNYRKCIEAMEISKFDDEDLMNPFNVLDLKDLAKNKQKFT